MAAHYTRCPGCGSEVNDLTVFRCENEHQFCSACAGAVSQANFVDPLGLFSSKSVCPRCHSAATEVAGKIRKYGYPYDVRPVPAGGNDGTSSIIARYSHGAGSTLSDLVLAGILYLAVAGAILVLMDHVARFSLVWWLCFLTVVAGMPLYIVLAYVTWYASMAVVALWGLMQIAGHLT